MSILEFLAEKKLIQQDEIQRVKEELRSTKKPLEVVLSAHNVSPTDLLKAKGEYFNTPIKDLTDVDVPFEILNYIPEESATHYQFVPIAVKDHSLEVGMVDPSDIEARDALNFLFSKEDMPFKVFVISTKDFEKVINVYKGLSGTVTKALDELESELDVSSEGDVDLKKTDGSEGESDSPTSDTRIIEDAPVTKIVATILRYAVEGGASDVHVEPMRDKVRVRFRVDGTLNTSLILPPKVQTSVAARIKILAKMKLDEKRKPQDGRFSAKIEGRKIDFRVSTFPSYYGEKVVMRILDQEKGVKGIDELGLSERYLQMLKKAIDRPYGMILISGPTGSGKSTTLYSVLTSLDTEKTNVLSLEDPVEYSVSGVSQSQVHPEIGYTFASGLRTTLRQDPDIIMVGEIRDGETAKLAIQAALTGHLVLSTIHTNTAAGIVPRLIDMGIDPYLIPPTLILGIGQRLTRKICPGTGEPVAVEGSLKVMLDKQFADLPEEFKKDIPLDEGMLKITSTPTCLSGTKGREAVFEMFEMDRDIEKVILENPIESAIYDEARKKGMITMKESAIVKALQKVIPYEEVNKL